VTDLLYRYEELLALHLADPKRLKTRLNNQQQVILALDGLQPDVGHEVLWVLRDCSSGEVLVARSLLGATEKDLVPLLEEVASLCRELEIPIKGVITDGQRLVRNAVASALPGIPHQFCHFHYLREAAKPIVAADKIGNTPDPAPPFYWQPLLTIPAGGTPAKTARYGSA
jgi:hypothetical protein